MNARTQGYWLVAVGIVFSVQTLPLFQYRWVEDESWESIPPYALLTEGRLRNPTFADTDSEYQVCVKPPGHSLLLLPVFKFFGVGVWQARLPSLLAGLGVVGLTFLLARQLAGPEVGVCSAWLVAVDNFHFLASRTSRPEVFVTFCALLAALLALQARGLGSGLAVGAAAMFHPAGAATGLGTGMLLGKTYRKQLWASMAGTAVVGLLFWLWAHSTAAHREAFLTTYSRGEKVPFFAKLHGELNRYRDFLGFSNLRLNAGVPVPVRAHIVLAILAAFGILAWKNRKLFVALVMLTLPYLLIWLYLINKTSRYFAVVAPFFAIALGGALCALIAERKWRVVALAVCGIVGVSQIVGNVLFLVKSRAADYPIVEGELQQLIPHRASVYGAITFWPALYDRAYYSYERMPFDYAIQKRQPDYLILNDRVMVRGMGWGNDDWAKLREQVNAYARAHGTLVGRVSNPFYGDLDIYHLSYP